MRYKKFGRMGWEVSVISAGTWTLGGEAYKGVDSEEGIRAIHALIERGVNHIDTAAAYSNGASEKLVGRALKGIRDKVYITTKGGLGPNGRDSSRAFLLSQVEDSLRNLQTDYIDNYIIHWPDPKTPFEETMGLLMDLKRQGKIRAIGVSNFSREQIEEALQYGDVDNVQMGYSMVSRGDHDLFVWAHDRKMATMSFSSLAAGILTGAYRSLPKFEEGDVRATLYDYFREPVFSQVMELLKVMDEIAKERDVTLAQIAINWSTQQPFLDTALVGANRVSEAIENCKGLDWSLSEAEMITLNQAIEKYLGGIVRIFSMEA